MDSVNLKIHIIPSERNLSAISDFDISQDGSNFSDKNSINVNKTSDGYSVIFTDTIFKYLDIKLFVGNLIKIFTSKVPNTIFNISIHYHYTTLESSYDYFDNDTARKIYELHGTMMMLISSKQMQCLQYSESETLNKMFDDINDTEDEMNDGSDDLKILQHMKPLKSTKSRKFNLQQDEEEYVKNLLTKYGALDDSDDDNDDYPNYDDEEDDRKIKKSNKKYYGRSRVFSNMKSPKQTIKKHNLLISKSNSDIKKDIHIIKDFLKDFIPGSARWKKKFRNEILQRWIASYVISKKNMKKFAKMYKNKLHDDEVDENVSTLANLFKSYQNS